MVKLISKNITPIEEPSAEVSKGVRLLKKGGKNWIQGAVNPKHEGFCTPLSKKTCTGKRRAFALTMKKHHGFHKKEDGGEIKMVTTGGEGPRKVFVEQAGGTMVKKGGLIKKHQGGGQGTIYNAEKGGQLSKEYIEKAREKPGGSNVGKKTFASGEPRTGPYAGPSGGAPKGSYPIPDEKHAKSALALAHNAPNPGGIKQAVYKKYPSLKKDGSGGVMAYATGGKTDRPEKAYTGVINDVEVPKEIIDRADTLSARFSRAIAPFRKQLITKSPKYEEVLRIFEKDPTFRNSQIETKLDSLQKLGYGPYPIVPASPDVVNTANDLNAFTSQYKTQYPVLGGLELQFNEGKLGWAGPRLGAVKVPTPRGKSPYGLQPK